MNNLKPLTCPHCGSEDVEASDSGIVIDTIPAIYYSDYQCHACNQWFAVKSDDENPRRAVIKDFQWGKYYPDDPD